MSHAIALQYNSFERISSYLVLKQKFGLGTPVVDRWLDVFGTHLLCRKELMERKIYQKLQRSNKKNPNVDFSRLF